MEKSTVTTERRSHKRFKARENVFAVIKRGNVIICKVANISRGGLLFFSEDLDTIENDALQVDLYIDDNIYISDVPVKVVSDFTTQDDKTFDGFPIRYLRLSFDELSKAQRDRIIHILENSGVDGDRSNSSG